MYCKNCGQKLTDNDVFCSSCGEKVTVTPDAVYESYNNSANPNNNSQPTNKKTFWDVSATIGFILGIVGLCLCWTYTFGFLISVTGIVFAAMGKKSQINRSKANAGLTMSIIGTVLSLIFVFIIVGMFGCMYGYYY